MMKFFLGFGIGLAAGLLFAPASGRDTRRRLQEKFEDTMNASEEKVNETVQDIAERGRQKAGELGGRLGRQAAEGAVDAVTQRVVGDRPEQSNVAS
jgi:gas vesicle protein